MEGKLKNFTKNITGFSLIETLACLVISGILVGLLSISFFVYSPKYKLLKAAWEINSQLHFARYKAIFEEKKVKITFSQSSYAVEIYEESQKKWKREFTNALEGITFIANNSPIFHPGGTVSNLASIFISNSWGKYKITIAISGRIKAVLL